MLFEINNLSPHTYIIRRESLTTFSCGRLVAEVRSHDEALFTCVACTQDPSGEPLLFAGTNKGSILQLAFDSIEDDGINGDREESRRVVFS